MLATLAKQPDDLRADVQIISVGAAGALTAPDAAAEIARHLGDATRVDLAVTSDVVTAHAGALDGEPGTVLVAGTGAVACGIDRRGRLRRTDGVGIWLGDDGSGRWIGQRGLSAALRAADGRGGTTSLVQAAIAELGPLADLPTRIGSSPTPERVLASFAPAVLDAAEAGDAIALAIRDAAAAALAVTARAAAPDGDSPVAVLGGLTGHAGFAAALATALAERNLRSTTPRGDALDGAVLIGSRPRLPHEKQVTRVRSAFPR
ncbi:ATPase [Frondihabitans sucicola]|uniref:ATPase n=1 Tax=Frondihabitans sucicola TaxID=1268041 RepID=A0ABM8GMG1_9MICO|nr:ATPase [Frondihabitans sucicola]